MASPASALPKAETSFQEGGTAGIPANLNMYSIRRHAYSAAWKGRDNQSGFNPFAIRGKAIPHDNDEELGRISTEALSSADLASTVVPITQEMLDAEEALVSESVAEDETTGNDASVEKIYPDLKHASTTPVEYGDGLAHPAPKRANTMPWGYAAQGLPVHRSDKSLKTRVEEVVESANAEASITRNEVDRESPREHALVINDNEEMKLHMRTLTGKSILLYERTLKSYDIRPGATIHVVLRLRGGGGDDREELDNPYERKRRFIAFKEDSTMKDVTPAGRNLHFTFVDQARILLFNSWCHILLLLIPVGFALNYTQVNSIAVFTVNFLAIVPSAMILAFAVDDFSLRVGEVLERLISMTFSNAVQLITSIFLLKTRQITVLQTSLIGVILSNLLLMTGLGFFLGGIKWAEQQFDSNIAKLMGSQLLLAATSLIIPTVSHLLITTSQKDIILQSRGTGVVLLLSYGLWLLYQLYTNPFSSQKRSRKAQKRRLDQGETLKAMAAMGAKSAATGINGSHVIDDEEDVPQLSIWVAIATIIVSTVLIAFNTQFATDSINGLLSEAGLSATFVGLVILPLLSNDPTTVVIAYKDKIDLSLAMTTGKCIQTSLMVIPLILMIAWGMDIDDMTLVFNGFEVLALFASILTVNYIMQDGQCSWIQGALLIEVWVIVSIAAYFVP
ncbi:hypothetical protein MMC27_003071 [Xylographa pallens]|nr:hypothetical protein [Xylographa pallens]